MQITMELLKNKNIDKKTLMCLNNSPCLFFRLEKMPECVPKKTEAKKNRTNFLVCLFLEKLKEKYREMMSSVIGNSSEQNLKIKNALGEKIATQEAKNREFETALTKVKMLKVKIENLEKLDKDYKELINVINLEIGETMEELRGIDIQSQELKNFEDESKSKIKELFTKLEGGKISKKEQHKLEEELKTKMKKMEGLGKEINKIELTKSTIITEVKSQIKERENLHFEHEAERAEIVKEIKKLQDQISLLAPETSIVNNFSALKN